MEPADRAEEHAAGKENLRAVPRFEVDEDASLFLLEHGSTHCCRIVDLGLNGCRMRTKDRFPVGAGVRVEVAFRVRGLAFRFCGTIQWTDGRNQAGIRFLNVPARRKEELVEAISEVEAAEAARRAAERQATEEQAAALRAAEEQAAAVTAAEPDELPAEISPEPAEAGDFGGQRTLFILPTGSQPRRDATEESARTDSDGGAAVPNRSTALDPVKARMNEQHTAERTLPRSERPAGPSLVRPNGRERREQSREAVDTSAVLYLIHVASRLTGRILDLSLGGCRIRTDERFPVGIYTRIETEFRLEGLPFRLGGVVQAIHDRHHIGIRFLDMSSRKREQVEQLIEEIEEAKKQGLGTRRYRHIHFAAGLIGVEVGVCRLAVMN
jgi:hypothetical protein